MAQRPDLPWAVGKWTHPSVVGKNLFVYQREHPIRTVHYDEEGRCHGSIADSRALGGFKDWATPPEVERALREFAKAAFTTPPGDGQVTS